MDISKIEELLGDEASYLLNHTSKTVTKDQLIQPTPDYVDQVWYHSDRNNRVLGNLQWLMESGRLGGTGYLSILPVDQGIEHSAGASFAKNPDYFDPENQILYVSIPSFLAEPFKAPKEEDDDFSII